MPASNSKLYLGKYRGQVASNFDLNGLGRIQITCPSVLGDGKLSWAMPCTPYAGKKVGFFVLPPKGANVWVEFEGGDPDYPIWSGCFWGKGEMPTEAKAKSPLAENQKVLKTENVTIVMKDDKLKQGEVTVEIKPPAVKNKIHLVCDSKGVTLKIGNDVKTIMTDKDITMTVGSDASAKMTKKDIRLAIGSDTSTKLSKNAINIVGAKKSKIDLKDSAIQAENGQSKVKIKSSAIEQSNGSGKVKIESSGVKINDGAVEVL